MNRAEAGANAKLKTWARMFEELGLELVFGVVDTSDEWPEIIQEEAWAR